MAVNKETVLTIATLAHLEIARDQVDDQIDRMNRILDLVDEMQAVNTDEVQPLATPFDQVQRLRADEVTESNQREKLQSVAPRTTDGLYLVPRVVE
ncbi:MAG: Asp-tRNA(Asn)/Glu-tRNA(Gln) amidotransferase subunit GatC [Pseudomonadota bacterium]